ncbi:hypothetical protein DUI87_34414 [Hirundo rustica rustica]|uniref:Uncharacterized protein n=1 Tax=Hirundo rustica rustica TaxID=333673 RepID=A0A3M0IKC8_HIRRU|nr:hypothetical protein DUI87_34414 [Hirundo rustica rustica]
MSRVFLGKNKPRLPSPLHPTDDWGYTVTPGQRAVEEMTKVKYDKEVQLEELSETLKEIHYLKVQLTSTAEKEQDYLNQLLTLKTDLEQKANEPESLNEKWQRQVKRLKVNWMKEKKIPIGINQTDASMKNLKKQVENKTKCIEELQQEVNKLQLEIENMNKQHKEAVDIYQKDIATRKVNENKLHEEVEKMKLLYDEATMIQRESDIRCQHKITEMVALMKKHKVATPQRKQQVVPKPQTREKEGSSREVLIVPRVLYHKEEEMYRFLEETIQLHKREVMTGRIVETNVTGTTAYIWQKGLQQLSQQIQTLKQTFENLKVSMQRDLQMLKADLESKLAGTSVLSPFLHIGSLIASAAMIYKKSAVQLFERYTCLYILTFDFVAAKITNQLVVAHMTKSEILASPQDLFRTCLLGAPLRSPHKFKGYVKNETMLNFTVANSTVWMSGFTVAQADEGWQCKIIEQLDDTLTSPPEELDLLEAKVTWRKRAIHELDCTDMGNPILWSQARTVLTSMLIPGARAARAMTTLKQMACWTKSELNVTSQILDELSVDVTSVNHAVLQNHAVIDLCY